MRLLAGILMLDGQEIAPGTLANMCDAMRAPVGHPASARACATIWQNGPIGIAVLESSGDADSVVKAASGKVFGCDARLDERSELQKELGKAGIHEYLPYCEHRKASRSQEDAVFAAASLERWGNDAGLRLLGDFALAAWDPRARELVLMRDHMGIRPMVYAWQPGKYFIFASFPSGVHGSGLVPRELDHVALVHSFLIQRQAGETLSQAVRELPPGHVLQLSARDPRKTPNVRCYWHPQLRKRRHSNPEDAATELRGLMTSAIESRVESVGEGRIAAHLSGGLDSTAVAVIASRKLVAQGQRLLAYSFLLEPQEGVVHGDESPYVEATLAQEPEIEWKSVWPPDPNMYLATDTDIDWGLSLSPSDPENVVCADASAKGASLVLSGWGGDEGVTFNGRGALGDAFLRGHWAYCAQEVMAAKRVRGISRRFTVRSEILGQAAPRWLSRILGLRGGSMELTNASLTMLSKSMTFAIRDLPLHWLEPAPDVRRNQLRLLNSPHLAVRTTNWASIGARFGQAFTFPMLDRRVVDFALSLPSTWHIRDARKRRVFRDAMEGILPEKIRWRFEKLTPFPVSPDSQQIQIPEMLRLAEQLAGVPLVQQIFNMRAVQAGIESYKAHKDDSLATLLSAQIALSMAQYIAEHFNR
jgi:asparagine synthase (glutamine-hydrolysing)